MELKPFEFIESDLTEKYTNLQPICRKTLKNMRLTVVPSSEQKVLDRKNGQFCSFRLISFCNCFLSDFCFHFLLFHVTQLLQLLAAIIDWQVFSSNIKREHFCPQLFSNFQLPCTDHGSSSSIKCYVYHHVGEPRHTPVVCNENRGPHTSYYASGPVTKKHCLKNISVKKRARQKLP